MADAPSQNEQQVRAARQYVLHGIHVVIAEMIAAEPASKLNNAVLVGALEAVAIALGTALQSVCETADEMVAADAAAAPPAERMAETFIRLALSMTYYGITSAQTASPGATAARLNDQFRSLLVLFGTGTEMETH